VSLDGSQPPGRGIDIPALAAGSAAAAHPSAASHDRIEDTGSVGDELCTDQV